MIVLNTDIPSTHLHAGAFFIWMLYAIGVQLTSSSEHCSQVSLESADC